MLQHDSIGPRLIIPRHGASMFCIIEPGSIVDIAPAPVPMLAEYDIGTAGWIAWIGDEGLSVGYTLYDMNGNFEGVCAASLGTRRLTVLSTTIGEDHKGTTYWRP
jgi:hypothetical protein